MTVDDDLTPDNFITTIKNMNDRDRKKIRAEKLIELILGLDANPGKNFNALEARIVALENQSTSTKTDTVTNAVNITNLTRELQNKTQNTRNLENTQKNRDDKFEELEKTINNLKKEINDIQQYLRVNNIEVIGLPVPSEEDNRSHEDILIDALNCLEELDYEITRNDIDISHPIPTRRKDGKSATVCRFISRKTKFDVLEAKKKEREFKYADTSIYINEHLSPENRRIFAEASKKRKENNYKYIWTTQGTTHVRKQDGATAILIDSDEALEKII